MKNFSFMRFAVIVLVGAALCGAAFYVPTLPYFAKEEKVDNSDALTTGGSSVVFFIMDKWKNTYVRDKGVDIVYSSSGSAGGVKKTIDKTYQIGFSSAPMTEEERKQAKAKNGEIVQIPVVLIAVAPIYNVEELNDKPPLKFTGEVLADIFMGKIKKWNDPALKKLNEGVELPDKDIVVVHRKDASGTTFLFTQYLASASETWKKEIGPASNEVKWPTPRIKVTKGSLRSLRQDTAPKSKEGSTQRKDEASETKKPDVPKAVVEKLQALATQDFATQAELEKALSSVLNAKEVEEWKSPIMENATWLVIGVPRNYGVAGHVKRTDGAIGYVETLHALTNKIATAAIQNGDKTAFLQAKPEYVTAAAKNLTSEALESSAFSLTNRPGKDAYPICGVEWAVCYQNQPASQQKKVADFLTWAVHQGQTFAKDLHYAPLPEELVRHGEQKIKSIKSGS